MKGVYVVTQKDIIDEPAEGRSDRRLVVSDRLARLPARRLPDDGVINEGTIFPVRMNGRRHGYPYHIPYRAILPKAAECDNLLVPVALSCTHVAYLLDPRRADVDDSRPERRHRRCAVRESSDVSVQELPYPTLARAACSRRGKCSTCPCCPICLRQPQAASSIDPKIAARHRARRCAGGTDRGPWSRSSNFKPHVGTGYLHDDQRADGQSIAIFRFTRPKTGRYDLRMAYSPHETRATTVPVVIESGGRKTELSVDQTLPLPSGEVFRQVGTVALSADGETTITVANRETNGFVILDAFQLIEAK